MHVCGVIKAACCRTGGSVDLAALLTPPMLRKAGFLTFTYFVCGEEREYTNICRNRTLCDI